MNKVLSTRRLYQNGLVLFILTFICLITSCSSHTEILHQRIRIPNHLMYKPADIARFYHAELRILQPEIILEGEKLVTVVPAEIINNSTFPIEIGSAFPEKNKIGKETPIYIYESEKFTDNGFHIDLYNNELIHGKYLNRDDLYPPWDEDLFKFEYWKYYSICYNDMPRKVIILPGSSYKFDLTLDFRFVESFSSVYFPDKGDYTMYIYFSGAERAIFPLLFQDNGHDPIIFLQSNPVRVIIK